MDECMGMQIDCIDNTDTCICFKSVVFVGLDNSRIILHYICGELED